MKEKVIIQQIIKKKQKRRRMKIMEKRNLKINFQGILMIFLQILVIYHNYQ
jgi:hypothetical protein